MCFVLGQHIFLGLSFRKDFSIIGLQTFIRVFFGMANSADPDHPSSLEVLYSRSTEFSQALY